MAELKGEFVWHHHPNEDELFLIIKGTFTIQLKDGEVILHEGEFYIVPVGVEHRPVAVEEDHALMLEPISTLNIGNVTNERTLETLDWI